MLYWAYGLTMWVVMAVLTERWIIADMRKTPNLQVTKDLERLLSSRFGHLASICIMMIIWPYALYVLFRYPGERNKK